MQTRVIVAAIISASIGSAATADGNWIIGGFVGAEQNPFVGGEDTAEIIPYIAFETERFHIGLDGISYTALETQDLEVELFIDPRFAPSFPDTALFDDLDRDDAIEVGASLRYSFGEFYTDFALQGDVSGAHDGYEAEAAVGYQLETAGISLDLRAGLRARDSNLNTYLYGVSVEEATMARPTFEMDNTVNAFAELAALVPLSDSTFLMGEISYTDLGEAEDSPLIDRSDRLGMVLGVAFQF